MNTRFMKAQQRCVVIADTANSCLHLLQVIDLTKDLYKNK